MFAILTERAVKAVTLPIKKETYTKIADKYNTPSIVVAVSAPRIDGELWGTIQATARSKDVALQQIQKHIIKGLIPYINILSELRDATKSGRAIDVDRVNNLALDGITLAGNASFELSIKRREELKNVLNQMYRGLCSRSTPISEMLFGKYINATMKQVAQAYKAGKN